MVLSDERMKHKRSVDVNVEGMKSGAENWIYAQPFPHFIVDDFFSLEVAKQLESDFPSFDSDQWHVYSNALEAKKLCNNWNAFPTLTYCVLDFLNSDAFVRLLSDVVFEGGSLYSDSGLNGGGWHVHCRGGKLNTHLDYSVHPKLKLQRKLNMIVYLNASWQPEWGGHLGLWGNESSKIPGKLMRSIEPKFNRAVFFDTTCNSWHGLPDPVVCPEGQYRKSLAVYYLTDAPEGVDPRGKALFAPSDSQKGDQDIVELIKKRASVEHAASVYITK